MVERSWSTVGREITALASAMEIVEEMGGHSMPERPVSPRDWTKRTPVKRWTWRSRSSVMKRITVVTTM